MKLKEQLARAICFSEAFKTDEEYFKFHQPAYDRNAQAAINVTVDWLEEEAKKLQEKHFASAATYRAIAKQLSGEQEKG